ncbi:MAG: phage tail sheath family protein [Bacillota bacterium]|nr:phage tail sheath family protein [Bacillota bacterium]
MALGGGTFTVQNKALPGSYINFVSIARAASVLSERGIAAMPLELDWGAEGIVFEMDSENFQADSMKVFGYPYGSDKMKGLRDLFKNIRKGYFYRLNSGVKAVCAYATAKYSGIRGNDLKIVIQTNVDDSSKFDVSTFFGTLKVDTQAVSTATELKGNDYVDFNASATLTLTAGTPLTGGTNGSVPDGAAYQAFLDKIESYSFNALGCTSVSSDITALFTAFTKRMRDELGVKFQTVLYRTASADHEGVISVENKATDTGAAESSLVYWVTGAEAGCAVNKSNTNKAYDGEYTVDVDYTQNAFESGLKSGKFMFHRVGDDVRVLEDINTFTSVTAEKSEDFGNNQTVRVLDQIANDIAVLFNTKYLGNVPNDASGRISLWNDIVKHHQDLQNMRAIEDFSAEDVTVTAGDSRKAVVVNDVVTPVNAMAQLYMTVVVE